MKTLLRAIAILMLLLSISIFLPVRQQRVQAEVLDCWESFNEAVSMCVFLRADCLANGGSSCSIDYQMCLGNAGIEKSDCEAVEAGNGQPWPEIDFSLSNCLSGCLGCNDIEDPSERMACSSQCSQYCRDNYPKN